MDEKEQAEIKKKIDEMFKRAEENDDYALCFMGTCHLHGVFTKKNVKKGIDYYTKSANMGFVDAQLELALYYLYTKRGKKDYEKGVYWLKKAVGQEDSMAQYHLGKLYSLGNGVERNTNKALELYHKSAAQINEYALHALGEYYEDMYNYQLQEKQGLLEKGKESEEQDDYGEIAFKYYQEGASLGYDKSILSLAHCYETGIGVEIDYKKAKENYEQLIGEYEGIGLFHIGKLYLENKLSAGSEQENKTLAKTYFEKSSSLNCTPSTRYLKKYFPK